MCQSLLPVGPSRNGTDCVGAAVSTVELNLEFARNCNQNRRGPVSSRILTPKREFDNKVELIQKSDRICLDLPLPGSRKALESRKSFQIWRRMTERRAFPCECLMDKTIANPLRGIMLKVLSLLLFIIMQGLIKEGGKGISAGEVTFFRSAFALVPVMGYLAWRGQLKTGFHTKNLVGHIHRGIIGVCAMGAGFYGILHLPLPESISLGYAMPLMTVIAGAVFLGEVVRLYRWSAVIVGFIGVMVIVWPRMTILTSGGLELEETNGAIAVLVSATLAALAMVQVRQLVRTENTATIVLYFSLSAAVFSLMTIPFGWIMPTPEAAVLLIAAGLVGGVAQIFLTECYRFADVSTVAPFEYTSIIWGTIIGYMFFAEVPTSSVVIGTAIIAGAGIFIIFRERQLNIQRKKLSLQV